MARFLLIFEPFLTYVSRRRHARLSSTGEIKVSHSILLVSISLDLGEFLSGGNNELNGIIPSEIGVMQKLGTAEMISLLNHIAHLLYLVSCTHLFTFS